MFDRLGPLRLVVALACLAVATPALAQPQAGDGPPSSSTLAGLVVDETNGVVPDVEIAAMNSSTGIRRVTASSGDGRFSMPMLPPGSYVVTAERQGFAPLEVRDVVLGPDACLLLHIQLQVGRVEEAVRVTAPMLAAAAGLNVLLAAPSRGSHEIEVPGELQRRLPLSPSRTLTDALFLASGVVTAGDGPSVHGASPSSTIVLLDGMDVTSNRQAGTALMFSGAEIIDRVDLKTAGMDVSAPLTQGAVIDVKTRSGGDTTHGEIGAVFAARNWTGNNMPGGTSSRTNLFEPAATLGGPIRRGRLSYFGAVHQVASTIPSSRSPATIARLRALVPDWKDEDSTANRRDIYAKLDARLSPSQVVSAFFQDGSYVATGPGGIAAGPFLKALAGGSALGVRWSATWSDRLASRVSVSYNNKTTSLESDYLDSTPVVVHGFVIPSGATLQGSGAIAYLNAMPGGVVNQPASKVSAIGELTWYRRGPFGTHELNAGIEIQPRLREKVIARYGSSRVQIEEVVLRDPANPAAGTIPFHRQVMDAENVTREDLAGSDQGLYVQDRWRPFAWVTLNAGLRLDLLADTDRITRGVVRESATLGPRASATVELTPRTIVHAGWGRVHESAQFNRYTSGVIPVLGYHDLYDADLDGTFESDFYRPGSQLLPTPTGSSSFSVDAHRGQPHVDELTAGVRQQIPGGIALQAGIVRRVFRDMPAIVNDALIYEHGSLVGVRPGLNANHVVVTANRWYRPVVTDLTLQAIRQTGRLQLIASYTRNWRHLSGTWVEGDPAAILQPGAFANDKGIGSTEVTTTDALHSVNSDLARPWLDHSFRLAAVWQAPWGTLLAGSYQYQSGPWSGPIFDRIGSYDPIYGPETITQKNGFIVNNPLATTMRFLYATRGEGQLRLPPMQAVNLRLSHRVKWGWGSLEPAIDVFNVTNRGSFITFQSGANLAFLPVYGDGDLRQRPRSVQASMRFVF